MADSDDEFDRRRRDKFARERNDYRDRRDYERDNYSRGREYGRDYERRRAYSPLRAGRDASPSAKRSRYESEPGGNAAGVSQPAMLTFKQFLASQDDGIDDQDAVKKYADYKTDFKRLQLEEFFKAHKEEEWFRLKYHPDECHKRKEQMQANIEKRLQVYQKVSEMGFLDKVELDVERNDDIIRVMDTVAIFLEGGDEEDLKALDEPEPETKPHTLEPIRETTKTEPEEKDRKRTSSTSNEDSKDEAAKKKKGDDDSGMSENEADDAKKEDGEDDVSKDNDDSVAPEGDEGEDQSAEGGDKDTAKKADAESGEEESGDDKEEADKAKKPADEDVEKVNEASNEASMEAPTKPEQSELKRPRHLHRTSSIFLRTLSAAITKQEVEAMCRNYPGFLRVALADPQPERKFHRRGWITFERHVNTKEICWKLNNIRLRDTELGAILNRDLSRRVRSVNGIVSAKSVMKSDMKLAAKIIQNLDTQRGLWMQPGSTESKNPLLSNITDYLIEEASAEEEELLGGSARDDAKADSSDSLLEKDPELSRVLDRLLWYLRIVHSFDYYSHSEYHNEDEMPNRCGIIHARGSIPTLQVPPKEIEEYIVQFEQKVTPYSEPVRPLSFEEAKKLGLKTEEEEVEKFMKANCQELAKEKFLCPLSGKKFKAPEFVHKHIINRHGEKLEELKKNVMYYNNYVNDPKRPMLPEHPANKPRTTGGNGNHSSAGGPAGDSNGGSMPGGAAPYGHYAGGPGGPYGAYPPGRWPAGYGPPHAAYGAPIRGYGPPLDHGPYGGPRYGNKRGGPPFSGGPRGIRDPRPVVGYHDLEAPPDFEMF